MLKYQRQVVYGVLSRLLSLNPFRSFDLQRCLRFHFIFQLWRKVTSRQRQRNWRGKVSFPPQVRRGNKERLLYRIFKVFICYINSGVETNFLVFSRRSAWFISRQTDRECSLLLLWRKYVWRHLTGWGHVSSFLWIYKQMYSRFLTNQRAHILSEICYKVC